MVVVLGRWMTAAVGGLEKGVGGRLDPLDPDRMLSQSLSVLAGCGPARLTWAGGERAGESAVLPAGSLTPGPVLVQAEPIPAAWLSHGWTRSPGFQAASGPRVLQLVNFKQSSLQTQYWIIATG